MATSPYLGFVPTRISVVRSTIANTPTLEPNMERIRPTIAKLWPIEIFQNVWKVQGRSSVGRQYYLYFLHRCHILLFCYVRNVACE